MLSKASHCKCNHSVSHEVSLEIAHGLHFSSSTPYCIEDQLPLPAYQHHTACIIIVNLANGDVPVSQSTGHLCPVQFEKNEKDFKPQGPHSQLCITVLGWQAWCSRQVPTMFIKSNSTVILWQPDYRSLTTDYLYTSAANWTIVPFTIMYADSKWTTW